MEDKRSRLRSGEVVELKPGLKGRLNKGNRTLELSTGEVLPIGAKDQEDLFPENSHQLGVAESKERLEREIKNRPFGEFLFQFGRGASIGGIQDMVNKIRYTGEEYLQNKKASEAVSQRISKERPILSGAATATSFIPDLYLTRGMSAAKAAPILSTISSGSRVVTEPEKVAEEAVVSGVLGKFLDIGANKLTQIAARRGEARNIAKLQAETQTQNIAGKQAAQEAAATEKQAFNALTERTKNENAARLHQNNLDVAARQNKMIQDKNIFEQRKAERAQRVFELEQEAKMAKANRSANEKDITEQWQREKLAAEEEIKRLKAVAENSEKEYREALKSMPERQKKAQAEHSENVIRNAQHIESSFPKGATITRSHLGVNEFIDQSVEKAGLGGTTEGAKAVRILNSLFPEGETLTASQLAKRYRGIEEAISKSSPDVQKALSEFKTFVGEKMPTILADNMAYARIMPSLKSSIEKEVSLVLKAMELPEQGLGSYGQFYGRAKNNIDNLFREITPEKFLSRLQNGEIKAEIQSRIMTPNDFSVGFELPRELRKAAKRGTKANLQELQAAGLNVTDPIMQRYEKFVADLSKKLEKTFSRADLKSLGVEIDASKRLGGKVKGTFGLASPVEPPIKPTAPVYPNIPPRPQAAPEIAPPNLPPPVGNPPPIPPAIPKASLAPLPIKPVSTPFIPREMPQLAPAANMTERTGDFLEKNLLGGKGLVNNPITKLAGLKYLLGKGAVPLEAGYLAIKGLTSPTSLGERARTSFKRFGVAAIEAMAQKYPSYQDGILQSPEDRRSLNKEIEDNGEIPTEQKAIFQSKINRGKRLQENL